MARGLFRVANEDPPSEPEPGARLICDGGWGAKACGLQMGWVREPCDRGGCPGYWAWRCRTLLDLHGSPDDILDLAAHGLSHDTREQELRVEALHRCPCGARDWEAGEWWVPGNLHALRFLCRGCGIATCVSELLLQPDRTDDRGGVGPRWGDPCPCGRSTMTPANDFPGEECSCCGGGVMGPSANPARPLCHGCQVDPRADEIVSLIVAGKEDRRLRWLDQGQAVRVVIPRVVPRIGPAGQRLSGPRLQDCRLRMMHAISNRLHMAGWASASRSNRLEAKYFVFRPLEAVTSSSTS